jgi:hypothetical protein
VFLQLLEQMHHKHWNNITLQFRKKTLHKTQQLEFHFYKVE